MARTGTGRSRRTWLFAVLAAASAGAGAGRPFRCAAAPDDAKATVPLPLVGRVTVRDEGKVYVVDGKQTIPGGSVIRLEQRVKVRGINNASLDVRGGLMAHGTEGSWVVLEGIDFGPTVSPDNQLQLDMCDLHGCRFVHGETEMFDGGITIENSCLQGDCKFDVRIRSGFIRIMTTEFKIPCRIEGAPEKGKPPEVAIRTCWMKKVELVGPGQMVLRDGEAKDLVDAKDFTDLQVDGMDLFGGASFHLKAEGSFAKLVLVKSNLLKGTKLVLDRPTGPKTKTETVRVDRFYFGGADDSAQTADKKIAERIDDAADHDGVSVRAVWTHPQDRKYEFLDPTLRGRAPP